MRWPSFRATNAVLAERNRAFERLFNIVLGALLVGSLALFLFASRLSTRIRRLANDAEAAIDAEGRMRRPLAGSRAGDEIGDLARSFGSVLDRLAQYASYREAIASRLSHELRTPIAVVRSSLDNLQLERLPDDARIYMERARSGLDRLNHMLTRMAEANRLEHMLKDAERERFDLVALVAGCVDGYRNVYPDERIELHVPGGELDCFGAPDLLAQALDKLLANAVEFSKAGAPIVIRLVSGDDNVTLSVANDGPLLPAAMAGRLFDSMVSVRPPTADGLPHLGLGLYIVRLVAEFHHGAAWAENRDDGRGIIVSMSLPM